MDWSLSSRPRQALAGQYQLLSDVSYLATVTRTLVRENVFIPDEQMLMPRGV